MGLSEAIEGIGFSLLLSESLLFFIALYDHHTIFKYWGSIPYAYDKVFIVFLVTSQGGRQGKLHRCLCHLWGRY
jgi:hypothetical protein